MIEAAIFDVDGTLVDSVNLIFSEQLAEETEEALTSYPPRLVNVQCVERVIPSKKVHLPDFFQ